MNLILFDIHQYRENLKPLTSTRPIANLRCGVFTIQEKWEQYLNTTASFLTENYLAFKYPANYSSHNTYINSALLPSPEVVQQIKDLKEGEGLFLDDEPLAIKTTNHLKYNFDHSENTIQKQVVGRIKKIMQLPHLFQQNAEEIMQDFLLLKNRRLTSTITDPHSIIYGKENIFIGKNVTVKAAIINAEAGPVVIDDNAVIQEGAIIIGPASIGQNAMVAYGAKIRANTSIGSFCRVGGEVSNSIFQANSNKAHDGFLGNSYIGEWCNMGANTNNSNLKNNFTNVQIYSYSQKDFIDTGTLFCGTFMGDYTKTGISTQLNTGTVIGVCSNLFGGGLHAKYIPDFSWGNAQEGYIAYKFPKAINTIRAHMKLKSKEFSDLDLAILKHISEIS